jgi:hypothetical protein
MLRSLLMSGTASQPLFSPDGVGGGGGAPGGAAAEPPAAAAEAAPAAAAPAPAADAPIAVAEAPVPDAGAAAAEETAAPAAKPADAVAAAEIKPAKEFAPSLLDEAAKPTAEAKPGDAAPEKDAAKPAAAKPSDKKEPAPAEAKPGGEKPADAKSAKDLPAEAPAPIEYAFTYPEGVKPEDVNPERLGAFTGILNDVRAPPEAGQKLLNLHIEEMTRVAQEVEQRVGERQWDVFATQQKDWRDKVMADPELGGARHATAIRTVMGLVDAFSLREQDDGKVRSADVIAAERKEILDVARMTGIANNPTFLRLLHWAGDRLTREGSARPAPPPRQQNPNPANRGLRRYQATTPAAS